MLTLGQLKEALRECQPVPAPQPETDPTKKYVYGLKGIRKLFNVSHATAQRYKDTFSFWVVRYSGPALVIASVGTYIAGRIIPGSFYVNGELYPNPSGSVGGEFTEWTRIDVTSRWWALSWRGRSKRTYWTS